MLTYVSVIYIIQSYINCNVNISKRRMVYVLTVKETAALLRVSERHAYRLIKQNVIPHTKIGGKILINKEKLLDTLEKEEA